MSEFFGPNDKQNILGLSIDENIVGVRVFFNDRFPDINFDPISVFEEVDKGTRQSVDDMLRSADVHPKTLQRIETRMDSFRTYLTVAHHHSSVGLLSEQGTGTKVGVIAANFLSKVIEEFVAVAPDADKQELFGFAGRMTVMYTNGLLVFDEMDPWNVLEAPNKNQVNERVAIGLLCTGMENEVPIPANLKVHYMHNILPQRFAASLMYSDLEAILVNQGLEKNESEAFIDSFLERRIEAVARAQQKANILAVSEVDEAFARPLAAEELQTFIQFASVLTESCQRLSLVKDSDNQA